MVQRSLPALVAFSLALSACGTLPQAPLPDRNAQHGVPVPQRSGQLELTLASGTYSCEQGVRVQIERETRDRINRRIHVVWNGNSYWLDRDPSYSGLPRFEDMSSGLVWIDLPWKGLLLDARTNKPLANECRSI